MINYRDHHLLWIRLVNNCLCNFFEVVANFTRKDLIVLLLLSIGRCAEKLDTEHDFILSQPLSRPIDALKRHLLPILLESLIEENLEFLLHCQLADVLGDRLGLTILLLVNDLPEPLVDLILLHFELVGELEAKLAWRHLPLILMVDFVKFIHLLGLLPIALLHGSLSRLSLLFLSRAFAC